MHRSRVKLRNNMKKDKMTGQDVKSRILELAKSYVPEWKFDCENPDIGSTIAILFAGQMEENRNRFREVFDLYQTEFVNMLDLSLLPAKPACALVLMDLVQDTIPGTGIGKGTKLLAEGEIPQIFETAHNLYVTNSRMKYCFMTEKETDKILPLLGEFPVPEIYGKPQPVEDTEDTEEQAVSAAEQTEPEVKIRPFRLFADPAQGIEQNAVMLYHSSVFDAEGSRILLKIVGNRELVSGINSGSYRLRYVTKDGLKDVEDMIFLPDGETVAFWEKEKCEPVELDGREYGMLVLLTEEPVAENMAVDGILLSSDGAAQTPEFVNDGIQDCETSDFAPFGDTLSLYRECYIGHNSYFAKPGSNITITFDTVFPEHRVLREALPENVELKIIKRKPRTSIENSMADCYAEEISIEYYNGIGWKRIPCEREIKTLFHKGENMKCTIRFVCPADWTETSVGGENGRCLRFQLLKSDNCYMRPCIHHYPQIRNMQITYSYEGRYIRPERVRAIAGTRQIDLTKPLMEEKPLILFRKGEYTEDYLYLGFDRPMEEGPVSLLFQLEDEVRYDGMECHFEYSTLHGFHQMRVMDHTANMSRSGIVLFLPPADMAAVTIEGRRACWIRISRTRKHAKSVNPPKILDICLNAVEVYNIETGSEEEYYIDEAVSNMVFDLGIPNILDVDLWVNETNRHSRENMEQMYRDMPDRVRLEKDMIGNISSFYVKWQETDQFGDGRLAREYVLDRLGQRLLFGDGIHSEIPRALDDVAFRMVIRCCNGQAGNVGAGKINSSFENLLFIDSINNPKCAFGGSNIESVESALRRGANLLSARRRLVSPKDYEREILNYSDNIDKLSYVVGKELTFILLLKDYKSGSYSFHNMAGDLKQHLLKNCELMIAPDQLRLTEPIFVTISVDVWVGIRDLDDGFEVQNILRTGLEQYLDAVAGEFENGWEIGVLPDKAQIRRKLNSMKAKAAIQKIAVTASYTDDDGRHEKDLDAVEVTPFMVPKSGTHKIHTMLPQ